MKRLVFIMMILLMADAAVAQPKKRRNQQQTEQQQRKSPSSAMSMRAQISFPTALDIPEEVVWRRDIYRELDLTDDANAGLYFPVEPQGKQLNLFTYIFKLAQNGYIPVYEYPTDGSDNFSNEARVQMQTILDNYHIYYEDQDGKLKVDNSDIPSAEVKKFYLKESAYYDQANSSDLEPFLNRQTIMASSLNNAATMSMDDFFTLNSYRGKIYKTNNAQGKTLLQLCDGDVDKMTAEQKRIEAELAAFHKTIFGDQAKKDSLDSIAALDVKNSKKVKSKSSSSRSKKSKASKPKSSSSTSSSNSSARVTVRRQRH